MSNEEKKAIDYLQLCYDLSTIDNESLPKLAKVLNLIEKQQKEIERFNNELDLDYVDKNFIPKDKIREKINERQFELQQEYKDFEDDAEWKTYNKLLGGKDGR